LNKTVNGKLIQLISEGKFTNSNFLTERRKLVETITLAIDCGVDFIQIREKKLATSLVLELSFEAVRLATGSKTRILINERFDIAISTGAAGVHLTSTSLPVPEVRRLTYSDFIIGVSTHSEDEIIEAQKCGATYATFGSVFVPKGQYAPKGIELLEQVSKRNSSFPILGLGGIDISNFRDVSDASNGFASIGFLNNHENLKLLANFSRIESS
jgi:thiamine-phosphate pyrophosphorylase